MRETTSSPGVVPLHLLDRALQWLPAEQLFQAMLDGWRNQQLARGLAFGTIDGPPIP